MNGSKYYKNPDGSVLYIYPSGRRRYTPFSGPPTPPPSPPSRRKALPSSSSYHSQARVEDVKIDEDEDGDEMDIDNGPVADHRRNKGKGRQVQ